jgi:uncharacterized protein YegJ (DUF2314 family)
MKLGTIGKAMAKVPQPRDGDVSSEGTRWPSDEWPLREYVPDQDWMALEEFDQWEQISYAQATFLEFARAAEYERFRIVPTYEAVGIKAFFGLPNQALVGEHIFLTNVLTDGKTITATLNADSRARPELKEGQEVNFPIEKLSDWFLVRSGRALGGFTIPHVWSQLDEHQRQQSKHERPFVWFWSRGKNSAKDELIALPKCTQCDKRNIDYPEDAKQPCAICRNGGWRCNCPKCGAPLIRNDKLPKVCARCM